MRGESPKSYFASRAGLDLRSSHREVQLFLNSLVDDRKENGQRCNLVSYRYKCNCQYMYVIICMLLHV